MNIANLVPSQVRDNASLRAAVSNWEKNFRINVCGESKNIFMLYNLVGILFTILTLIVALMTREPALCLIILGLGVLCFMAVYIFCRYNKRGIPEIYMLLRILDKYNRRHDNFLLQKCNENKLKDCTLYAMHYWKDTVGYLVADQNRNNTAPIYSETVNLQIRRSDLLERFNLEMMALTGRTDSEKEFRQLMAEVQAEYDQASEP